MHVPAAAGAAASGAAGLWLFEYNRGNYQFDQGMRFTRFLAARGFANAQTAQYREDVSGITELTATKMDAWSTVNTLFLCVCAALSDAGRIGMHGCAPPGWLCALYSGHVFTAVLYIGLSLWLSMHGSLRAQCAAVSLRTRKVRLPIPSTAQLDAARNFGSAFEKQEYNDIFRVPFMRHPEWAPDGPPGSPGDSEEEAESKSDKEGKGKKRKKKGKMATDPRTTFGSTTRTTVPSWIRDEQVVDKGTGTVVGTPLPDKEPHETPDHFKMLQNAQEEWYQYDIYARITMLYGVCQFLFAVTYYSLGTVMAELRGFWIAWSLPLLFMTAQALILRLDILSNSRKKFLTHVEWLGHTAPYWAVLACTLDYRWTYSPAQITITWVFVILCFFGHFMFQLRLLDLAWPDSEFANPEKDDEVGKEWWPHHWRVPVAFSKAMWILAPPKKLEPGIHDLLHEMSDLAAASGGVSTCRRRKKGGSSSSEKSPGGLKKKPVTTQSVMEQVRKVEKLFDFWFDKEVWKQVHENEQRKLHYLFAKFEHAQDRAQRMGIGGEAAEWSSGSGAPTVAHMEYDANGNGDMTSYYYQPGVGQTDAPGGKMTSLKDVDEKVARLGELIEELDDSFTELEGVGTGRNGNVAHGPSGAYVGPSPFNDYGKKRPNDLPWQLTRISIFTVAFTWFYMMIASGVESSMSSESLLKPPGEPPWIRDQKLRWQTPGWVHDSSDDHLPSDYRLFIASTARYDTETQDDEHGDEHVDDHSGDSSHRRLSPAMHSMEGYFAGKQQTVPQQAMELGFLATMLKSHDVQWPAFFEPRHLACSPPEASETSVVAALTTRGFGARTSINKLGMMKAKPFALQGVGEHGPIAGASWTRSGLRLLTAHGHAFHCPGHLPESASMWPCEASTSARLPIPSGVLVLAAAITEITNGTKLALLLENFPRAVFLFDEDSAVGEWSPVGEVHLPASFTDRVGLSFTRNELLAISGHGDIHRWHLRDGTSKITSSHVASSTNRDFQAACAHPSGHGFLRLALTQANARVGSAWGPELLGD